MVEIMIKIERFLNTNKDSENLLDNLFGLYSIGGRIDIGKAKIYLEELAEIGHQLGNIKNLSSYKDHCPAVSETSEMLSQKISRHYHFLNINPEAAYFGLVEDFMRCIANEAGQEIHEIIGYIYLKDRGLDEIAEVTQLHFVGPEILDILHSRGIFNDLEVKQTPDIRKNTCVVSDALSTTEYLGESGMEKGFYERVRDMRERYGSLKSSIFPNEPHLLIQGLDNNGETRLRNLVIETCQLCKGKVPISEVRRKYL